MLLLWRHKKIIMKPKAFEQFLILVKYTHTTPEKDLFQLI